MNSPITNEGPITNGGLVDLVKKTRKPRTTKRVVPVPPLTVGMGTAPIERFPEPGGTEGTTLLEGLGAFMDRTKNLPPPAWLVERVIPDVGQVWLIGVPGCGKTWLALYAAGVAAAKGRDVVIVEEEGGCRGLRDRINDLAFPIGVYKCVTVSIAKGVKLAKAEHLRELEAALRVAHDPVLILDPMTAIFTGNENETEDAGVFRDQLAVLMRAHPRTLALVLHHTSKGSERNGQTTYAGRGSSVFTGAADLELLLKKVAAPRGLGSVVSFDVSTAKPPRDREPAEPVRLTLTLGTGELAMEPLQGDVQPDLCRRIREALATATDPQTKSQIIEAVRGGKQAVLKAVDSMWEDGELEKVGKGYRLLNPAAEGLEPCERRA